MKLEHSERNEIIKVDEEDIEKVGVHVCVLMCVCVHVCVCVYVCMYACTYVHMCIHTYTYLCRYNCMWIYYNCYTQYLQANAPSQDKVEDIIELTNLNESSVLHVLRQRYASSLIHTFAGRHLIVINPLRPLSLYTDRVIGMFKGCRREDMPPHIFAMGQQAYRSMMNTRSDQSLVLMGLSGSGKTFNARYLLRYLATVGQSEHAVVTSRAGGGGGGGGHTVGRGLVVGGSN